MKKKDVVFTGSLPDALKYFMDKEAGVKSPDPVTTEDILAASGKNAPPDVASGESPQVTKNPGAQRGNKNALSHGVYSQDLVLPWESEEELRELYESLKEEYQPEGCSEEHALLSITKFMWLQRRANNMALLQLQAGMPDGCHGAPWEAIRDYQRQTPERLEKYLQTAEKMMEAITTLASDFRTHSMSAPTDTPEGKQTQSYFAQLTAGVDRISAQVQEKLPAIQNIAFLVEQQVGLFSKAYDPDQIERQVAIEAAVEALLGKVFFRLTATKEFKKLQAPKLVPAQRPGRPARVAKKELGVEVDVQLDPFVPDDNTPDKK